MAKHLPLFALLALSAFATHAGGYVQHVPGDVSDSRQQFQLRVARGEVVDVSIDFFDGGEPLDLTGAAVTLHTRTNGMDAAESWRTAGTATNNSALFVLDVDAVLPQAAGQWSCVASRGGRTLARVGGPAYVRGTAAGSAAALPQSVLAGYATTNYVAGAIAAIPPPEIPPETDPVFAAASNRFLVAETDPVFAANSNRFLVAESDPEFSSWADLNTNGQGRVFMAQAAYEAAHASRADDSLFADRARWLADDSDPDVGQRSAAEIFARLDSISSIGPAATNYTDSAVATRLSRAEAEKGFTEWEITPSEFKGEPLIMTQDESAPYGWLPAVEEGGGVASPFKGDANSTDLSWTVEESEWAAITATRTRLRPTPEMEASWDAKLDDSDLSGYATSADLAGYSPTGHVHALSDITGVAAQTWIFTLTNGVAITNEVLVREVAE